MIINDTTLRRWATQGPYREEREEMERWARRQELWDLGGAARDRKTKAEMIAARERKTFLENILILIGIGFCLFMIYGRPLLDRPPDSLVERAISYQLSQQIDNPTQRTLP